MNLEIADTALESLASYWWGSDQRVPVIGEHLDIGPDTYKVRDVFWRLQPEQKSGTVPATHVALVVEKVFTG